MLVLSRQVGETVVIRDDIHVQILRVDGGRVAVGIEAPKDVSIRREELPLKAEGVNFDVRDREKKQSA